MLKHSINILLGSEQIDDTIFTLLDSYSDPTFLVDLTGKILYTNTAFTARIRKHPQEYLGANAFELHSSALDIPEIARGLRVKIEEVLNSGNRLTFEEEQHGNTFRHTITPFYSHDRRISHLFVIVQDTIEKLVEPEEQKKLALHKIIHDTIPCTVVIMDAEGRVIWLNKYAKNIIAVNPEDEMIGLDAFKTIHPDDQVHARKKFLNILNTGIEDSVEVRRSVVGSTDYTWRIVHGSRLIIDGKPYILAAGIDITDHKRIEIELIESQKRLSQALEAMHAGVWEWDMITNKSIWSDELWDMYGLDRSKGAPSFELWASSVHPDDLNMVLQVIEDVSQKAVEMNFEYRVIHQDGSLHWLMARGIPSYDNNGRAVKYIGTNFDITERKQEEKEREQLQEQLQQSQKMELVGQLAGGIAHDFNNVLTAILGNTELLLRKIDQTSPLSENLENIRQSAIRSANLVNQILTFARKQRVNPKIIQLDEATSNLRLMLSQLISENVHFDWRLNSNHSKVRIDPSQFDQILTNLCVNARDAINGSGTITIETSLEHIDYAQITNGHPCKIPDDYVKLSISDTGRGIDLKVLPHIFEPFFTTKEVGKGTGLGLSMVYGIVTQNNGCISCDSNPGRGASFNVYLPVFKDKVSKDELKEEKKIFGNTKESILLVEDESYILIMLKDILENQGYKVFAAKDAEEAVIIMDKEGRDIKLLVTDIMLPNMNGLELNEKLLKSNPDLRVLFMSGYAAEMIDKKSVLVPDVNFLQKPFTIDKFASAVYESLRPI